MHPRGHLSKQGRSTPLKGRKVGESSVDLDHASGDPPRQFEPRFQRTRPALRTGRLRPRVLGHGGCLDAPPLEDKFEQLVGQKTGLSPNAKRAQV